MFKKLKNSPRCQFLLIAVAIGCFAIISGLFAYLTDVTDPLTMPLEVKLGDTFKISMQPVKYDKATIIPDGEPVPFDPQLENQGDYDIYAFIEICLPDADFKLNAISSEWTKIEEDGQRIVFAYGSAKSLTKLEKRGKVNGEFINTTAPELTTTISLDRDTDLRGGPYEVEAVGYAIQADVGENNPNQVWDKINDELAKRSIKNTDDGETTQ